MATTFIESDELQILGNPAVLVGVTLPDRLHLSEESMLEELGELTKTAGAAVVAHVTQRLAQPDGRTFCGKGKAEEVAEIVRETGAKLVIFDNDLKPHQQRALGELTKARVIDRTELILQIFADHARTDQAKKAVMLAQLQYQLPRLRHMWTHLERQRGSLGAVGGAGERQIETDRRIIRDRISKLKRELEQIERRRVDEVRRRAEHFKVALVGYTNAGKSTLMHALTEADVYIADKLFATLDTRTRIWEVESHKVLLSDTVGFIRDLPHDLVAGFQATLAETIHADLLLHVVDCSHPDALQMVSAVEGVLAELGALELPKVLVLNKIDRSENHPAVSVLRAKEGEEYKGVVAISALTGEGFSDFRKIVSAIIEEHEAVKEYYFSASNGKLLAFLNERCKVLEQEFGIDNVRVKAVVEPRYLQKIRELGGEESAPEPFESSAGV